VREIKVGDTARRSMFISDEQIELFARLSGDGNPLQFDEGSARKTKFGRHVATAARPPRPQRARRRPVIP
jgi:acyl dehydratase